MTFRGPSPVAPRRASSRRLIPGLILSLLLAAPALAAEPSNATPSAPAATHRKPVPVRQIAYRPAEPPKWTAPSDAAGWQQTGIASWYGGARWHGHPTFSGALFNENALTAAHRTLPMGTRVRVQLEGSDRSVVVLINDRPGTRTRIIDLSRAAAAELGILERGIAKVTLTSL